MAVFTAIASAIVTAIGVSTATIIGSLTVAGLATSVIAGGLAFATAKALGVFEPPSINGQASKDPGVKVQLPPATDNKVPVFYGKNYTGAILVDAEIKNRNNTMVYVGIIGEKTDGGNYTIQNIYRGDAKLNFSGATVVGQTDPNSTSSTNVNGKIRCRVYAGNALSADNQIFPTTGKVAAQTLCSTITTSTNYEDLVYAIFEVDYDPENGLTGLGTITYEITNDLTNPANVLLDYLKNDRYGAGLTDAELDLTSFADMYDYANAQVSYTTSANVSSTHSRWEVNGMLSTYQPVKTNIDKICQASATWFSYDPKQGKFKVVPNRAATTAEKANAFVFNDQNIVSRITVTGTELYSMYNAVEVEYPSAERKDQTDIVIVETPSGDRNPNEPDNSLNIRYDCVNSKSRAYNLANIDLNQSRLSTVLEFDADYSAIQVDVGDVVKVTNAKYGFSEDLYRVMQVTENETPEGILTVNVVLLQYSDDFYTHTDIQDAGETGLSLIPGWWTQIGNTIPNIGNIVVVDNPNSTTGNVVDPGTGNVTGTIDYGNITLPTFPPGGWRPGEPYVSIPINLGNANVSVDEVEVDITPRVDPDAPVQPANPPSNTRITVPAPLDSEGIPNWPVGEDFYIGVPTTGFGDNRFGLPNFNAININSIKIRDRLTGAVTPANTVTANANIAVRPQGYVGTTAQGDLATGAQIEDRPPNNTSVVDSSTTSADLGSPNSLITTNYNYDIYGIQEGDFSIIASTMLGGSVSGPYDVAFAPVGNVSYIERWAANNVPTGGQVTTALNDGTSGFQAIGVDGILSTISATQKVTISNAAAAAAVIAANGNVTGRIYTPNQANVQLAANTSIVSDPANGAPRSFINNKFDILRLTKGDNFYGEP